MMSNDVFAENIGKEVISVSSTTTTTYTANCHFTGRGAAVNTKAVVQALGVDAGPHEPRTLD